MEFLLDSLFSAALLVFSLDPEVLSIVGVSLRVSGMSILLTAIIGVPLGFWIAFSAFPGKRFLITCLNTLLAVPTVVIGLFVYSFISRKGILGSLDLLYTQPAIIIGQILLILPWLPH